MYVCLCNGYRDSDLRELARRGFSDAEDAFLALGDGPCCGGCLDFAQTIMDTERAQPGCPDAVEAVEGVEGVEGVEDKAA